MAYWLGQKLRLSLKVLGSSCPNLIDANMNLNTIEATERIMPAAELEANCGSAIFVF